MFGDPDECFFLLSVARAALYGEGELLPVGNARAVLAANLSRMFACRKRLLIGRLICPAHDGSVSSRTRTRPQVSDRLAVYFKLIFGSRKHSVPIDDPVRHFCICRSRGRFLFALLELNGRKFDLRFAFLSIFRSFKRAGIVQFEIDRLPAALAIQIDVSQIQRDRIHAVRDRIPFKLLEAALAAELELQAGNAPLCHLKRHIKRCGRECAVIPQDEARPCICHLCAVVRDDEGVLGGVVDRIVDLPVICIVLHLCKAAEYVFAQMIARHRDRALRFILAVLRRRDDLARSRIDPRDVSVLIDRCDCLVFRAPYDLLRARCDELFGAIRVERKRLLIQLDLRRRGRRGWGRIGRAPRKHTCSKHNGCDHRR